MPPTDQLAYSDRFEDAVAFALAAFRHKRRKATGIPYAVHLLAVCALVGEHGGDEDQMIAAVLHDYLEDVPGSTADELRARFGARVAELVVGLSDTTTHPKPPWRVRKEGYLARLPAEPPDLKLVCCADKLHNCRSTLLDHQRVGNAVYERFNAGREGTLWYYRGVVDALGRGWAHRLLDELHTAVDELHRVTLAAR